MSTYPITIVDREILFRGEPVAIIFNADTIHASTRDEFESILRSTDSRDVEDTISETEEKLAENMHDFFKILLQNLEIETHDTLFEEYPPGMELLFCQEVFKEEVERKFKELKDKIKELEEKVDPRI